MYGRLVDFDDVRDLIRQTYGVSCVNVQWQDEAERFDIFDPITDDHLEVGDFIRDPHRVIHTGTLHAILCDLAGRDLMDRGAVTIVR